MRAHEPTDAALDAWAREYPEWANADPDDTKALDDLFVRDMQAFVTGIPDLEAWHAQWDAEAERTAHEREIGRRADELHRGGMTYHLALQAARNPPELDPDTLALLERAEQLLMEYPE